tara:strand:+ start:18 stop:305 length:288 start_codon:yes stop_codon:yes gene_type:complete
LIVIKKLHLNSLTFLKKYEVKQLKKLKITKKIISKQSSTTIEAIKKITIGDYRFQLVIKGEKILGTISDGDIRRSMIKGNDLNSLVSLYMNKKLL